MRRIGIDVGGTNTDAVLMDDERVLSSIKVTTTKDIGSGIELALMSLLKNSSVGVESIKAVMIGTTQFVNAVIERRRLQKTAIIRIGLPATAALPPTIDWPEDIRDAVTGEIFLCRGGHEYDGTIISELDRVLVEEFAGRIKKLGLSSAAVTSVFSTVNPEMEKEVADILYRTIPGIQISLSHEIGRVGLLERENATILNAALNDLAEVVISGFRSAMQKAGIRAPIFVSQNDGTLMSLEVARKFPVVTFASGPTNSMRGASFLSGHQDCIVVDVGGTSTDVGVLTKGFPREASSAVVVSGVRTNFRMPDVYSIALGGGTEIEDGSELQIGPGSVGADLSTKALVFGGNVLTTSDVAVAVGRAVMGDHGKTKSITKDLADRVIAHIDAAVEDAIDHVRIGSAAMPVILVGGGSVLLGDQIAGIPVIRPEHFEVANAIGAAIAQISGEIERVVSTDGQSREIRIEEAKREAIAQAVLSGANEKSIQIVEIEEIALPYVPGGIVRLRVKAVGDLNIR